MQSNEYGICRCCLTKGNHRNISKEYMYEGDREVYIEIFMDCFNLFLSTDASVSQLICKKCITSLRGASQFRSMVADAEKQLLTAKHELDTVFVNVPVEKPSQTVKHEIDTDIKLEDLSDDDAGLSEYVLPEDLMEDNEEDYLIEGEADLLARCSHLQLKLPTVADLQTICPEYAAQLELLKNKTITSKMIKTRLNTQTQTKNMFVSEKHAHITNAKTLIQNSNLIPFKSKTRSGFPCFYCRNIFEDLHKLREHAQDHKTSEIIRVLKQSGTESLIVYAEVTDLKCNLCNKNIQNIPELKSHLTKTHQKKIYAQVSDRVIPFKMKGSQFECQICAGNFETFGAIERHMNGHYRNYVCKDCGSGFITKYRLKVHTKSMHVDGNHPCEFCGKIFSTQQKYKNHVNAVHKQVKRFKCAKCSQRFTEYFKRQRHMEEVHGVTPLKYHCNVCDRSFDRRYTLSRHLKRDHLEERDYQCEICAYKCFTKNELKVHMVKHNGERIFECSVCKKSYARKKTLREHMRIHNNDRRFSCAVCGQAFVQKCSLKGHIKTHHWTVENDPGKCDKRYANIQ